MNLSRKNSLNWQFGPNGEPPMNRPELPCMRQIAHELLTTLQKFRPQLKDAAKPVIPPPILEEEEGVHYVMHGSSKELDAMPWPSNSFLSVDHKPG
jgi:hypothetical protein